MNLIKKSFTKRHRQNPEIHPDHAGVPAGKVQPGIAGRYDADGRDGAMEFGREKDGHFCRHSR